MTESELLDYVHQGRLNGKIWRYPDDRLGDLLRITIRGTKIFASIEVRVQ